jgi:cell division protein FtsB
VVVAPPAKSVGEDVVGWIAALFLVGLLLPLGAMLYMDILEAKHEVKAEVKKVEKLRREIEKERRDANPDRPK